MAVLKVHVEYCGKWGYASRYRELAKKVKEHVPDAEVTGAEGRSTSFEITMNDQLIFSKLETKGFPYAEDIIDAAQKASRGETVSKITKKQNCVVM